MIGHEWAIDLLKEHVAHNKIRHAYLFTGPGGVGRRTLALRLAQAINCPQPLAPGEPCLTCRTCSRIERMQHPDLAVVQAEQVGGTLKVEQIRELQRSLALSPYEGRYRIALLLRFEEAHPSAANALLKTLEEPPDRVILLLTAESPESLLPTVASRCEVLRLRPLALDALSRGLQEHWGVPAGQADMLANLSAGRLGAALRLFQQAELLEQRRAWLQDHHRLLKANRVERFNYANTLAQDKEQARDVLQAWLSLWRDVFLQAVGASIPLVNLEQAEEIANLANRLGAQTAFRTLSSLQRISDLLERNVNTRLAVEVLMLDLPFL